MKKLVIVFIGICLSTFSFANGSLVKGGKQIVQTATLGNMRIKFPPKVARTYQAEIQERFFTSKINAVEYPVLSARNDAKIFSSIIQFKADLVTFQTHAQKIAKNIKSKVYLGAVPYKKYLPQDVDYLYIGEIHHESRIQKEVAQILSQLPAIYPNRPIYLAAEILFANEIPFSEQEELAYPEEVMRAWLEESAEHQIAPIIRTALDNNIRMVGLDPLMQLMSGAAVDEKVFLSKSDFEDYVSSAEGITFRNTYWSRIIKEIHRRDPSALVVVYGGIDHVAYHNYSAVPSLVGGKGFVLQVLIPPYLPFVNPFFKHFQESSSNYNLFHSSENAKLVNFWIDPKKYNRLLGADLSVLVHE
jgi:hypothetical protein